MELWTTEVPNATSRLMGRSSWSLEDTVVLRGMLVKVTLKRLRREQRLSWPLG